ncbi:condensation domain-containing protein, partial [Denitromonas iodatirespirans]
MANTTSKRDLDSRALELVLARMKKQQPTKTGADALAPLVRCDRSGSLPLSLSQQRLWFIDKLEPEASRAYNMVAAYRLSGDLDVDVLQKTFNEIVSRHESLRCTFIDEGSNPTVSIAPPETGFLLDRHDLSALPEEALPAALVALADEEGERLFDLGKGPLVRGVLIRTGETSHVMLLIMHHIISDGWSMGVFVRELKALYEAFLNLQPSPLPPLQIQYPDFAAWQRSWLEGEGLHTQIEFWRTQLSGAPEVINLPFDRSRPTVQTFAGGFVPFEVSEEKAVKVRQFAKAHKATVFMALMAAWSAVLARIGNNESVVVGTPVAGRNRQELESLIGFFANTLALRFANPGDATIERFIADIKERTLSAYRHQGLPFEQVVEIVNPPRSLSHSPIFQVMFALDNTPDEGELELPGLKLSEYQLSSVTSQVDMSLLLNDTGKAISGSLVFNSDLFDKSSVERIANYLGTLLDALVAAPADAHMAHLPLLPAPERHQVLVSWNATDRPYPRDMGVHTLFEAQALAQPEAVAVIGEAQQLS